MAKAAKPLSEVQIRNAKPQGKPYTLFDGGGLHVVVNPNGSKLWRMKTQHEGKAVLLSFGHYPAVSLSEARKRRLEVQTQKEQGISPVPEKIASQPSTVCGMDTFEKISREWHRYHALAGTWCDSHIVHKLARMEKDLFPLLGQRPVTEITTPELLKHLQTIMERGALDGAHRLRFDCEKIFAYAIASGKAVNNPALQLKGILPPVKNGNHPAFTQPADVSRLLKAIDSYTGSYVVRAALKLAPLLFVRPGELRSAEWSEIDLDAGMWSIPGSKMKMKVAHLVPLSTQAVDILKELNNYTGSGQYVFPHPRTDTKYMSENAVNAALRGLGFTANEIVGHGFRATARTMIRERLRWDVECIEIQLAHTTKSANGTAYDRVAFLDERIRMMQEWADYLDGLRSNVRS